MKKQLFQFVSIAMLVLLGVAGCTSFEEIKARADGGDPSMQYRAGLCYRDGKDVQANLDTAYSYFKKAADGGSLAGALCYAQEALRRKDISEPVKFLERIQKVFTEQPRNSEDRNARWEMRRNYPKFCIEFATLLQKSDLDTELVNFRKKALQFFSKKYLYRHREIIPDTVKLLSIRTKKEVAEYQRRDEEKRKAWEAEKRPRQGETIGQYKERVYRLFRIEANCPPRPGESFSAWRKRAEQAGEPKSLNERMAAQRRYEAAKRNFDLAIKKRLAARKKDRLKHAEAKSRALIEKLEKAIKDPLFKYPCSKKIMGIELCNGYFSGLAYSWVKALEFLPDARQELERINHNFELHLKNGNAASYSLADYDKLSKSLEDLTKRISAEHWGKGITFYFDKQYGVLHSVSFKIKGDSVSVTQKIAEYKKKFLDLKHTRKAEQDERTITYDDRQTTVKWTIYTDTLESDRVKIVITSNNVNKIDVTIWIDGMSKLEKKKLSEYYKTCIREEYEKTAEVVITDKAMKQYFESLKKK